MNSKRNKLMKKSLSTKTIHDNVNSLEGLMDALIQFVSSFAKRRVSRFTNKTLIHLQSRFNSCLPYFTGAQIKKLKKKKE